MFIPCFCLGHYNGDLKLLEQHVFPSFFVTFFVGHCNVEIGLQFNNLEDRLWCSSIQGCQRNCLQTELHHYVQLYSKKFPCKINDVWQGKISVFKVFKCHLSGARYCCHQRRRCGLTDSKPAQDYFYSVLAKKTPSVHNVSVVSVFFLSSIIENRHGLNSLPLTG